MKQTVNLPLLQGWIDKYGIGELEKLSGISVHTIMRIKNKRNPAVPKRQKSRIKLAEALGVTEDALFPAAAAKGKKSRAS